MVSGPSWMQRQFCSFPWNDAQAHSKATDPLTVSGSNFWKVPLSHRTTSCPLALHMSFLVALIKLLGWVGWSLSSPPLGKDQLSVFDILNIFCHCYFLLKTNLFANAILAQKAEDGNISWVKFTPQYHSHLYFTLFSWWKKWSLYMFWSFLMEKATLPSLISNWVATRPTMPNIKKTQGYFNVTWSKSNHYQAIKTIKPSLWLENALNAIKMT